MTKAPSKFDEFYWKYLLEADAGLAAPSSLERVRGAKVYKAIKAMLREILTYDQRVEYFGDGEE